jgi:hypothetical protein
VVIVVVLAFYLPVHGEEILNTNKLGKKAGKLTINRDIFSPDTMKPQLAAPQIHKPVVPPPVEKPPEKIEKEKEVEDEILRSVFFEGYVIKHPKNFALVSVNSEFFAVGVGDIILERIKIIKIDRESITVEVDSRSIEIQLKGDDSNDK